MSKGTYTYTFSADAAPILQPLPGTPVFDADGNVDENEDGYLFLTGNTVKGKPETIRVNPETEAFHVIADRIARDGKPQAVKASEKGNRARIAFRLRATLNPLFSMSRENGILTITVSSSRVGGGREREVGADDAAIESFLAAFARPVVEPTPDAEAETVEPTENAEPSAE